MISKFKVYSGFICFMKEETKLALSLAVNLLSHKINEFSRLYKKKLYKNDALSLSFFRVPKWYIQIIH